MIGALSKATAHGKPAIAVARCAYDAPAGGSLWDPKRQFEAFFTAGQVTARRDDLEGEVEGDGGVGGVGGGHLAGDAGAARPGEAAEVRGGRGDRHRLVDGTLRVDQAGALGLHRLTAVGSALETRVWATCRGVQSGWACMTRAAAPSTAEATGQTGVVVVNRPHRALAVDIADRGALGTGGGLGDARGLDIGLDGVVAEERAPAGEGRHPIVAAGRADRESALAGGRGGGGGATLGGSTTSLPGIPKAQ